MSAAATEDFATVEERYRYRYRFGESSNDLAVVVVEGEEGHVTMSADVQGSVLNVHDNLHRAFPFHRQRLHTSDILFGHNNIVDVSIGDQYEQHLAQIRGFSVTVAEWTREAE